MHKIFVVGSINMDLVIKAESMPAEGETLSGSGFMTNPGGKGANQAVAVGKLGGEAYMVGCVGKEFGEELKNTLVRYGVHTDFVKTVSDHSSGIAVIIIVDGDNRIILDAGANALADLSLVDNALATANAGDYLICQQEIPLETVSYALKRAKEKGMITLLNPAPAKNTDDEILAYCDYFIPNQTESAFYTGIYPKDEASAIACAERLCAKGAKTVLITLGSQGSCVIENGEYHKINAVKAAAVDTTAAGDTFVGAFAVGLSEELSVLDAMSLATKASAITVTRKGAQQSIPLRKELV